MTRTSSNHDTHALERTTKDDVGMAEPITLTDDTLDQVLATDKPIFVLITNGDGLRGDFKVAFNKQANDDPSTYIYARLDPTRNPRAAQLFGASDKPLLVGWYCGEEVVRRPRPWGSDLPLALEHVERLMQENNVSPAAEAPMANEAVAPETAAAPVVVLDKPVNVTDATFEAEVLNSDLPVMVDFWAAWCGPCKMVAPILDKLAAEFAGQIKIAKVDVDANPSLSQAFQIRSIPNLMIIKQRNMIFNQPGALPEAALRDLIQQAITLQIPPKA
jgi:thioredoxin 1